MNDIFENRFFLESEMVDDVHKHYLLVKEHYEANTSHVKQLKKEVADLKRGIKKLIGEPTHTAIAMQLINDLLKKHLEYKHENLVAEERLEYITYIEKRIDFESDEDDFEDDFIDFVDVYDDEINMADLKRLMPTFDIEAERSFRLHLRNIENILKQS